MNNSDSVRKRKLLDKAIDEVRFIRSYMVNPMKIGAISPSSRGLTRLMASFAEIERPGPVIELGPGTGVVTKSLLKRGIAAERLFALEYDPEFCALLRKRFNGINTVQGDAYRLRETLTPFTQDPIASVISSLPLFTQPMHSRRRLITEALDLLSPGAPFIQFSYTPIPPVPAEHGYFSVERSRWVMMNLPPARVWVYRRDATRFVT